MYRGKMTLIVCYTLQFIHGFCPLLFQRGFEGTDWLEEMICNITVWDIPPNGCCYCHVTKSLPPIWRWQTCPFFINNEIIAPELSHFISGFKKTLIILMVPLRPCHFRSCHSIKLLATSVKVLCEKYRNIGIKIFISLLKLFCQNQEY